MTQSEFISKAMMTAKLAGQMSKAELAVFKADVIHLSRHLKEKSMPPDEQRIAIAIACGWNPKPESSVDIMGWGFKGIFPKWWYIHQLPDYFEDLNAMHSAEKELTEEQWPKYLDELCRVQYAVHAPADKRAEAFLKAIGK